MEQQNYQLVVQQSKLIKQIVDEEFGEESGLICEAINSRGQISLSQLIFSLKNTLDEKTIKYLMILLIKNGVVQFDKSGNTNLYFVNQQMVLSILRFPSYMKHIKQLYGLDAESIIEYYLNNSQGSFDECCSHILAEKKKYEKEDSKASIIKKKLKDAFILLAKNNYINRFDSGSGNNFEPEELSESKDEKEKALSKKSDLNTKRKRGEDKDKVEGQIRKQVKKSKKNLIDDDELLQNELEVALPQKEAKKEEQQNTSDDYLIYDPATKQPLSYKINVRQFIHVFRTEEISKLAEGKLSVQAKQIIKLMLDNSQRIGPAREIKTTEPMSLDQIKTLLIKAKGKDTQAVKDENLQNFLRVMKRDGGKFISIEFINGKEMYSVNVEKIINKMKIRHIAQIVERKYSLIAGRIFRIMRKYKHLEEKAISDIALQSLKDTQKYLNKLSTEGYIDYIEVKEKDKTVNLLCMYKYDEQKVLSKTIEQYYQALLNLKIRLNCVYKREKELEEEKKLKIDDPDVQKQWQQSIKMIMNLEMAIIELDLALLAFTEF
ncbi:hypothetical protein ABPG74_018666 [Tetrahymena malaccensis]